MIRRLLLVLAAIVLVPLAVASLVAIGVYAALGAPSAAASEYGARKPGVERDCGGMAGCPDARRASRPADQSRPGAAGRPDHGIEVRTPTKAPPFVRAKNK